MLEKSFLPDDVTRGLDEYARAAALSPNNYLFWLDLGNARARDGDLTGAEGALRIGAELAPSYASIQWALGNVLLRQGKSAEAFASIQKAAIADPEYTSAGANVAWQVFGGDIDRIRGAVGDSPAIIGAMIPLLTNEKRDDEALTFWNALSGPKNYGQLEQTGTALYTSLLASKRFRDAANVYSDVAVDVVSKPEIGKIANGGFESDIK
ncbi:MAG: tetratricopeptide repeat protein, partial [Candidatus Binatia bacterium]